MAELNPHHAAYVGSFDPLTLGHLDIIRRGAALFDKLTVGIGLNPDKRPLLAPDERESLCRQVLAPLKNVEVKCFEGLTVNFVRDCGAAVMLRGMRTLTDIELEFTLTLANRVASQNQPMNLHRRAASTKAISWHSTSRAEVVKRMIQDPTLIQNPKWVE